MDVRALRARFNSRPSTSENSSRDSGSPKSPRPGFGRYAPPTPDADLQRPAVPLSAAGSGPRFTKPEAGARLPKHAFSPIGPPSSPIVRAPPSPQDSSKVKQAGEMLQNMMLRHQGPPGAASPNTGALFPPPPPPSASSPRQPPRQRSAGEVVPLRRPLPPEGPLPLKPKRPPFVNLEPFVRQSRGAPPLPGSKRSNGSPGPPARGATAVTAPPKLPERPSRLPHQVASIVIDDDQETYDDIASCDVNGSLGEDMGEDIDDEVYQFIDDDMPEVPRVNAESKNKKEAKRQREQEKKEQMERQKKQNELKKKFQLQGEVEVLHTASVRHDWHGGSKLDLSVQQGEKVEIIRVKNNPGGKWLARSMAGKYGYISNTCVDIDYEAVKRKVLQARKIEVLPPPPPDPPQMSHMTSNDRDSMVQDDDDYDDVQPLDEFPPPPPEISVNPKLDKELRKKFKFEGPTNVVCTMMVDPSGVIKKPGSKDLPVMPGEVLEVIQLTDSKKALCRNRQLGKYGYVSRHLLLSMEGDIYDDVDYGGDIYDNDSMQMDE